MIETGSDKPYLHTALVDDDVNDVDATCKPSYQPIQQQQWCYHTRQGLWFQHYEGM